MLKSYLSSKEQQYTPVPTDSDEQNHMPVSNENKAGRQRAFVYALLVLDALHLFIFLAVYTGIHVSSDVHLGHELDTHMSTLPLKTPEKRPTDGRVSCVADFALSEFNTVKTFYSDGALINRNTESKILFEQTQKCMYEKGYLASHALSKFQSMIS